MRFAEKLKFKNLKKRVKSLKVIEDTIPKKT